MYLDSKLSWEQLVCALEFIWCSASVNMNIQTKTVIVYPKKDLFLIIENLKMTEFS